MKLRILTVATVAGLSLSALLFAAEDKTPNPMETMQAQRQVMQQQMQQIREAKTPGERQQLMEAHRLTMQGFMQNMQNMRGGMMQGGMMHGAKGGMGQGGMMGQGMPKGAAQGDMMQQRMQMMEGRMDAMQDLMVNMLDHQSEANQ